jgi:FAD/FMN-containing dehydrogenase
MPCNISVHKSSRRSFGKTMTSGPLILGMNALSGSWVACGQEARTADFKRAPRLQGALSLDEATRRVYAQDYGQIIHELPSAVLRTQSAADIEQMIEFARQLELGIAVRGQGHQPFGQAQVARGLVIDMRALRTVNSVLADRVDVDAGADWRTVLQATLPRGLTPPVLAAYLGLTVGGTLAIGGIGVATFRHGAQVDNVLELEVITGEGRSVICSDTVNRDLFEAALAGQGQCGIIKRAVLRLISAPALIREYTLPYADVSTLLQDEASLIDDSRFDGVVALLAPMNNRWSYALMVSRRFTPSETIADAAVLSGLRHIPGAERVRTVSYAEYADSVPAVEFEPSHPDLGLLIPGSAAGAFLSDVLPRLTPDDLGAAAGLRLFSWKRGSFTRPLLRVPGEERFVYMAMLRAETSDPRVVARMLAGNRTLFEQNRDLGGALYPFSALQLSREHWQRHYGERWPALLAAKRRYDPDNVFASGPDIFRKS